MLPWKGPAGSSARLVRYMGTQTSSVRWRSARPLRTSAPSKENEQPRTKATRSSVHWSRMSGTSSASSPSRQIR